MEGWVKHGAIWQNYQVLQEKAHLSPVWWLRVEAIERMKAYPYVVHRGVKQRPTIKA